MHEFTLTNTYDPCLWIPDWHEMPHTMHAAAHMYMHGPARFANVCPRIMLNFSTVHVSYMPRLT